MTWSEGYGASTCKVHAPRYHIRDFRGEGARGHARANSEDPMVWSDNQWRSTLMGGYARDYDSRYDRRSRRAAANVVRIERRVEIAIERGPAVEVAGQPATRQGPKLVGLRGRVDIERMEQSSRFTGHHCRGILVLTWKAGVARSRCYDGPSRIRRAP